MTPPVLATLANSFGQAAKHVPNDLAYRSPRVLSSVFVGFVRHGFDHDRETIHEGGQSFQEGS